jgi:hypothetical protein
VKPIPIQRTTKNIKTKAKAKEKAKAKKNQHFQAIKLPSDW